MAFTPSQALCKFFAAGDCKREDCVFAHDLSALDSNICRFYLKGICFYGEHCRYAHVEPYEVLAQYGSTDGAQVDAAGNLVSTGRAARSSIRISHPSTEKPASNSPSSRPTLVDSPVCVKPERPPLCQLGLIGTCTLIDCPFRHGEVCEMCRCQALDPFDANQRAAHEQECCKAVELQMEYSFALQRSQQVDCGVCYEKVLQQTDENRRRFGILPKCDHAFCFDCIMNWRKQAREGLEESALRSCPMCRTHSDFAIPSLLWPENAEQKERAIEEFKIVMKEKPCRTFLETKKCPFGSCCWYKHVKEDGTVVQLKPPGTSRRRRRRSYNMDDDLSFGDLMDMSDYSPNDSDADNNDDDDDDEWEEDLPSPAIPVHLDDDPNFTADIMAQLQEQTAGGGNAHAEYLSLYCGQRNNATQE
ncbi:uncharacterized protein LOC129602629 isoform X2 [Paramacrobiotus metropolitanus]|uniref:uncharacterized protein LOC129602629 isoform X2 n=1 Tax=Paramacrobiotus metropolitanus TaxID=2943436 RepID=UPI0024459DCA|nr:uncharacterized protein LOC129602629 isoform X2 [Paramacrobiotus metropolitanus]